MSQALLCSRQFHQQGTAGQHKTKYVCEEVFQSKNHEDHIAGKGMNSLSHKNLVHEFIPVPEAMKIPDAKTAVEKKWEKLEKISAWNLTKVKYIDTKHQIADILTKGHFTRDEWNNLLCLFNISHFSSLCCTKNLSLLSCITERMAKRMQEQAEREQDCG